MLCYKIIPLFCICLLLLRCSSINVVADYDTDLDYEKINSFAFVETVDRSDISPLVVKRIKKAIITTLEGKGYEYEEKNPDLLVDFHGNKQEQKVKVANTMSTGMNMGGMRGVGGRGMGGVNMNTRVATTTVSSYTTIQGTLYIIVTQSANKELVWKSVSKGALDGIKTPQQISMKVDQVIRKSLRRFPVDKKD